MEDHSKCNKTKETSDFSRTDDSATDDVVPHAEDFTDDVEISDTKVPTNGLLSFDKDSPADTNVPSGNGNPTDIGEAENLNDHSFDIASSGNPVTGNSNDQSFDIASSSNKRIGVLNVDWEKDQELFQQVTNGQLAYVSSIPKDEEAITAPSPFRKPSVRSCPRKRGSLSWRWLVSTTVMRFITL